MKKLKSGLAIIVSFVLLFGIGLPGAKLGVAEAAPGLGGLPSEKYFYDPEEGALTLVPNLTVTSDADEIFADGYLKFAIAGGYEPGDRLSLKANEDVTTSLGTVSFDGTNILLNGLPVGTINTVANGVATDLQVDFSSPLENGNFEEAATGSGTALDLPGWVINSSSSYDGEDYPYQIWLGDLASKTKGTAYTSVEAGSGTYTVTGCVYDGCSPDDTYEYATDVAYSGNSAFEGVEKRLTNGGTFEAEVYNDPGDPINNSDVLRLGFKTGGITGSSKQTPYGTAFRAEAWSENYFEAKQGDKLAFEWRAFAGSSSSDYDDYEVYGFLVDQLGNHTELMYGRGKDRNWTQFEGEIPADGEYKFRFVVGSFDQTGGLALGATLLVDNVRVLSRSTTSELVEAVANLVIYEIDTNAGAVDAPEREVSITVVNSEGEASSPVDPVIVVTEPRLKLISAVVADNAPDQAVLTFNIPINGGSGVLDLEGLLINGLPIESVISVDDEVVVVQLQEPAGPGALTLIYDADEGNVQSDKVPENKLPSIGEGDLDNGEVDNGVTPLILDEVIIDGENPDTATLDFNKPVGGAGLQEGQPIPGFAIGGKPVKVITIGVDGDLSKVVVEIAEPYEPGDAVTYTPEDGEGIEEDINSNNKLGPIDADDEDSQPGRTVEEDQLILVSAIVNDDTPDRVTLTFNRPVDDETINWSGFTVNGYNIDGKISANDNDNTIVLQLAEPLGAGDLNVLYNDEAPSKVGTYFNPDTNLLGEITIDNPPTTAVNNVIALELIKVTTVLDEPNQLRLKFNMPISEGALTPDEAIAGFLIGADKPVSFVSINNAGDEMIVSLEEPYDANDQISYDSTEGNLADADNPNNKLGMLAGSTIPLISGKLEGIELANGGETIELAPAFNPNNNEGYVAVVPNEVTSVSVDPSLYNPEETFTKVYLGDTLINPVDGSWDNVGELQEGPNVITVQVFDKEDLELPVEEQTVLAEYKITIIRATGKLASLVPSDGTLAPAFDAENEGVYEVGVSYSVSDIQLTPTAIDPGATITMSINGGAAIEVENGAASADMALKVGLNTIVVTVTDSDNQTKTYTVEVRRADYPYVPVTPPKQTITIDVVIGGDNEADIVKVDIERTTQPNGKITDQVTFTPEKAKESAEKAEATGETIARMMIPDPEDKVSEINVDVTKETLKILQENGLDLEIYSDHGVIQLPHSSMSGLEEEFYFRLVPVRDPDLRSEVEERARTERIVREMAGDNTIEVVTRPMTIETNLPSRPVTLVLPLRDVMLPTDAEEREAFLNELSIFIEHSDGDKELVKGQPVTMLDGELGLQFSITKFSTFTIVHADAAVESHDKYINGFPDGTFRPERGLTRAQLATILVNLEAAGSESGVGYPDVPADHWAADAIKRVQAAGLMEGYPDGTFRPERVLTRAEMATFAFNFLQLAEASDKLYPDVEVSHWAHDIISALTQEGLIGGYPDGSFQPEKDLSRAEAVSLINRLFDRGPLFGVSGSSWSDVSEDHWAFHDIMEASLNHDYKIRAQGGELLVSN